MMNSKYKTFTGPRLFAISGIFFASVSILPSCFPLSSQGDHPERSDTPPALQPEAPASQTPIETEPAEIKEEQPELKPEQQTPKRQTPFLTPDDLWYMSRPILA